MKAKTILLVVLVVLGVLLAGLGGFLMYKWRQIKKSEVFEESRGINKNGEEDNLVETQGQD